MVTFNVPFFGDDIPLLKKSILQDDIMDLPIEYSQELNLLLRKLLMKNPLKRPSCQQILETPLINRFIAKSFIEGLRDPIFQEIYTPHIDLKEHMLSTIRAPKEFLYLQGKDLPPPYYPKERAASNYDEV
jgi:serine/threonine protein kinase